MKIIVKIAIAFITTYCLYVLNDLFIHSRSDILSIGGWYYLIISVYSLLNSLFVLFLLKSRVGKHIRSGNWKIILLIVCLYVLGMITDKIIYFIPKETTGDSFFYDVPATLLYPYLIILSFMWIGNVVLSRRR